jgi:hypothetical protein
VGAVEGGTELVEKMYQSLTLFTPGHKVTNTFLHSDSFKWSCDYANIITFNREGRSEAQLNVKMSYAVTLTNHELGNVD